MFVHTHTTRSGVFRWMQSATESTEITWIIAAISANVCYVTCHCSLNYQTSVDNIITLDLRPFTASGPVF